MCTKEYKIKVQRKAYDICSLDYRKIEFMFKNKINKLIFNAFPKPIKQLTDGDDSVSMEINLPHQIVNDNDEIITIINYYKLNLGNLKINNETLEQKEKLLNIKQFTLYRKTNNNHINTYHIKINNKKYPLAFNNETIYSLWINTGDSGNMIIKLHEEKNSFDNIIAA